MGTGICHPAMEAALFTRPSPCFSKPSRSHPKIIAQSISLPDQSPSDHDQGICDALHACHPTSLHPSLETSSISNHTRRGLVITTVAASLVANAETGCFNPSNNKHMARALVHTGQEKEEQRLNNSAVDGLKRRISSFSLDNGMRWIVLERHKAPVVACRTYANVGASREVDGCTGIAHLLEHLAFKGTEVVGTSNAKKEAALLDELDDVFYSLRDSKRETDNFSSSVLKQKFMELQSKASSLVIPNAYGSLIAREGGVGLNAETSQDATEYFVSLPANKLELWMALESGRFLAPVFRELYAEKEVIKEERRFRVDNSSYGQFMEVFTKMAFPMLPYGRPIIGYPVDLENIGRREVGQFFKSNYTPKTLTCAVVGDVNPIEVERLAKRYFGGWDSVGETSSNCLNCSPVWRKENGWGAIVRSEDLHAINMKLPAQPFHMEGYYRPAASSSDNPTISMIDEILSGGRLSRFYKNIILEGKALSATSVEAFPGDRQPSLFLLYGMPATGAMGESLERILRQEVESLASGKVKEEEVARVKKAARASFLELFGSNKGMAKILCKYEASSGTYSNLFSDNELIEAVTSADISHVASLLFHPKNCIKGTVLSSRKE